MKKIITLVLALALVLTSVVAIAETVEAPAAPKGTPNINTFATMKVKYVGGMFNNKNPHVGANNYYEITLSKPVDRLLVKWAEKGAEPEELAVDENLQATAIAWGHKYMPGTTQYYATWVSVNHKVVMDEDYLGKDICTSEDVYKDYVVSESGKTLAFEHEHLFPVRILDSETCPDVSAEIDKYMSDYPIAYDENGDPLGYYDIQKPTVVKDEDGNDVVIPGYIQLIEEYDGIDPESIQTVIATPDQAAFLTVQGEWAVYYNRAGKIVGIEYFDGQF